MPFTVLNKCEAWARLPTPPLENQNEEKKEALPTWEWEAG